MSIYDLDPCIAQVLVAAHLTFLAQNLADAKARRLKATGMELARAEGAVLACKQILDSFTASVQNAATVKAAAA